MKTAAVLFTVFSLVAYSAAAGAAETSQEEPAGEAQTEDAPEAAAETAEKANKSGEKSNARQKKRSDVICKRMPMTGSRRVHRVCHTREEWEAMENAAKETMRDIESQPRPVPQ